MKRIIKLGVSMLTASLLCIFFFSVTALAGTLSGHLDTIDDAHISGWAWNSADTDETVTIELHIYSSGSDTQLQTITLMADAYRDDLHESIGDGYHGFSASIDWAKLKENSFRIKAYAISGEEKLPLNGTLEYTKPTHAAKTAEVSKESTSAKKDSSEYGPGVAQTTTSTDSQGGSEKGASLGIFTTTGYCNCSKCSGGHNLTYSGTVPKASHTISADIDLLPLGTKVMINDIVYTVEDIGTSVNGKKIDIFYSTHDAAWAHGMQQEEVFAVQ